MCLIIQKPAGIEVPYALLDSAWEQNPDGAGIMYKRPDAEPVIYKVPVGAWADPVAHISKVLEELKSVEVGIHFRWRTHGPITADNIHPYRLPSGAGWIMHNGILKTDAGYKAVEDTMSDTAWYVANYLNDAPPANVSAYWHLVGADIGAQNKMLLLDTAGAFHRINEKSWSLYKGLYLSNLLSTPESAAWLQNWREREGWDSEGTRGTGGVYTVSSRDTADRTDYGSRPPARLTRRERKVLATCLRVGHWGPYMQMSRGR